MNFRVQNFTCLRTRRVMSTSPIALVAARPIITAFPPSLTLLVHCMNVSGFPSASTATSTPLPPVISYKKSKPMIPSGMYKR